jgi:flagellar biosynthesis protein FlhA
VETLKFEARRRAADILTRQSTAFLIDQLRESSPATVDELVPGVMKTGQVQQVLQALLRDGLSIKPLNTILEALADHYSPETGTGQLVEAVRRRLAPWITGSLRDSQGRVRTIALHRDLQLWLGGRISVDDGLRRVVVNESVARQLRDRVMELAGRPRPGQRPVALVVPPALRLPVRDLLGISCTQAVVLGADELAPDARIETIAILALQDVQYVAA